MNTQRWPFYILAVRSALFLLFQGLFALLFLASGVFDPWNAAAVWWPAAVVLGNFACLFLLARLFRAEGCRYWEIFRVDGGWKRDLLPLLAVMLVSGPVAMLPNTLLANALYGDPLAPTRILFTPPPALGLVVALALFPVTQGLVELPLYFRYVMPRISAKMGALGGLLLASLVLGFQHAFIPLRFDGRFFTWRLLMFVPFALLCGAALRWKPRLLPYMAVVQVLMDFFAATTFLTPL